MQELHCIMYLRHDAVNVTIEVAFVASINVNRSAAAQHSVKLLEN